MIVFKRNSNRQKLIEYMLRFFTTNNTTMANATGMLTATTEDFFMEASFPRDSDQALFSLVFGKAHSIQAFMCNRIIPGIFYRNNEFIPVVQKIYRFKCSIFILGSRYLEPGCATIIICLPNQFCCLRGVQSASPLSTKSKLYPHHPALILPKLTKDLPQRIIGIILC